MQRGACFIILKSNGERRILMVLLLIQEGCSLYRLGLAAGPNLNPFLLLKRCVHAKSPQVICYPVLSGLQSCINSQVAIQPLAGEISPLAFVVIDLWIVGNDTQMNTRRQNISESSDYPLLNSLDLSLAEQQPKERKRPRESCSGTHIAVL